MAVSLLHAPGGKRRRLRWDVFLAVGLVWLASFVAMASYSVVRGEAQGHGQTPAVTSNAVLASLPSTASSAVLRLGYAFPGDGPQVLYMARPTCPYGPADNGSCIATSDGKFWVAALDGWADVRIWGAKCDVAGANTDDSVALNAALKWAGANNGEVLLPNSGCRSSATVVAPIGANLAGAVFAPQEPPTGSQIVCDLTVTPCVEAFAPLSGSTSRGGQTFRNLVITRAGGRIPAGVTCFLDDSFKVTVENVNCDGHAFGFEALGRATYGIVAFFDHVWTCNITDSDVVQNGFAELHVDHARLGCNGTRNYKVSHNNYVKITGGAAGPNTLWINDSQLNDIQNPTCAFNWTGLTVANPTVSEFKFRGNHLEITGDGSESHSIFCSDRTATAIANVLFSDNVILDNNGTSAAWNLDPATALGDWKLLGNEWDGFGAASATQYAQCRPNCGWRLAPGRGPVLLTAQGEIFNRPNVTLVGPSDASSSSIDFNGSFYGGLTIAGNFGAAFPIRISGSMGGGKVINTATSPVEIDIPGFSFTDNSSSLGVAFGGVPARLSTKISRWQIRGSWITVSFYFQLGDLENPFGRATLTGLPFTVPLGTGGGGSTVLCSNIKGLSVGPINLAPIAGTTTALFTQQGPDGYRGLSRSHFTPDAICAGELSYPMQ